MTFNFFSPGILVHIALVFYAAGFMVRDELWLRLLVLTGSFFYLLYYFLFPAQPLWDAIFASSVLIAINLVLIIIIIRERTHLTMSADEAEIFKAFKTLTPGQFRKMMSLGHWKTASEATILTKENHPANKLYYVFTGQILARKDSQDFEIGPKTFIGEIGYVLGGPASATITATAGAVYMEWNTPDLRHYVKRNQAFENALIALFNFDLARKVANSIGKQE